MSDSSLVFLPARTLASMLHSKEISAVELLELHLDRMKRVNPAVNAIVTVDEVSALRQAAQADELLAQGKPAGPLHGLPMTVKDSFETAGMRTTCGMPALRDHEPTKDAAAVANLRAAGAIVFGKTNVPEGAGDHQTYNEVFGRTDNPWDLGRTPGGSSGGAAVAIATGMSPLEIGSDVGGSIRVPAHFCGIFGHNPSYGLVPLTGHIPPPPGSLTDLVMAVAGPFGRSASDLEWALDALATPNDLDRKGRVWRLPAARHQEITDFQVALWADDVHFPLDPAYAERIHAFADDLRRLGVKVTEARPEIDPHESIEVYAATMFGMWSAGLSDELFAIYAASAADPAFDSNWAARISRGSTQSVRDWNRIGEKREQIRRIWEAFFDEKYDVLICPVITTAAFPHDPSGVDHTAQLQRSVTVGTRQVPYLDLLLWPGVITLPKLPSTVVPTSYRVDKLPIGVQVVSAYLDDRTTLRFAQLVEEALGGFVPPPEDRYLPQ